MIQPAHVGLIMCTQGCFGVRDAQTCLGYSVEDLDPNLFICGLPCDPTGRAPSSNQSVRVVSFSKKPLFDLHSSIFFFFLSFFSLFVYSHSLPSCVYYLLSLCQPLFPVFSLCSSQHLSQCFPSIFPSVFQLTLCFPSSPSFIVSPQWGIHHYHLTNLHTFSLLPESQEIIMLSNDSLETCSKCQITFGSKSPQRH